MLNPSDSTAAQVLSWNFGELSKKIASPPLYLQDLQKEGEYLFHTNIFDDDDGDGFWEQEVAKQREIYENLLQ